MPAFKYEGSVSEGTQRPENLIPKFIEVLEDLNPDAALMYQERVDPRTGKRYAGWKERIRNNDDLYYLLGDLLSDLNEMAPEGYYFGSHPSDGADFGFWKDEYGSTSLEEDEE